MWKYVRLLRLEDQYLQIGSALAAGVYLHFKDVWIIYWIIAITPLSFTALIVNELTDAADTDKYSWNTLHVRSKYSYSSKIIALLMGVFSFVGLAICYFLGVLGWGVAIWLIGLMYSLKPIRLKARVGLDIVGQLLVWWVLPFIVPIVHVGQTENVVPFVLAGMCLVWGAFYPYQIADYSADKKVGLKNTHVLLGVERSLLLGFFLCVIGIGFYLVFDLFHVFPGSLALVVIVMYSLSQYVRWFRIKDTQKKLTALQRYVLFTKPLSQLLLPIFFVLWLVT